VSDDPFADILVVEPAAAPAPVPPSDDFFAAFETGRR
jgi:hypothetical protein